MLKINKKNKSVSKEQFRELIKKNSHTMIFLCTMGVTMGTMFGVLLYANGTKNVNEDSESDLNRAIIEVGEYNAIVDLKGYSRTNYNSLTLKDGTVVNFPLEDYKIYNNKSEQADILEENATYIDFDESDFSFNGEYDRVMIDFEDNVFALNYKKYSKNKNLVILKLNDGTNLLVSSNNLKLYNGNSKIMRQIEEEFDVMSVDYDNEEIKEKGNYEVLINSTNGVSVLNAVSFREINNGQIIITLTDGSDVCINESDLLIYQSSSPIMQEIKNKILEKNIVKHI